MNYKKIVKLKDTIDIPVNDNQESLVMLDDKVFKIDIRKKDMVRLIGNNIWVRSGLAKRLNQAGAQLIKKYPDSKILVTYGYRSKEVQEKYFFKRMKEMNAQFSDLSQEQKIEKAHSMSAHPDSAGHTCGAAVDISLWDGSTNQEWDMGAEIAEFGDKAFTAYPYLTKLQKKNRLFLQNLMTRQGFAPFLGEWWHFSYGDKEWAFYYQKRRAIYAPIKL